MLTFFNALQYSAYLTLPVPILDKEKKSTQIFIFTLLCSTLKGFMKSFSKHFETPQRSVKIKINLILQRMELEGLIKKSIDKKWIKAHQYFQKHLQPHLYIPIRSCDNISCVSFVR